MNIVPRQSQDEKPSAAQEIIFKLLFETPPSPRVPGPWWSELFGQRHQRDLGLKLLCPFAGIDSSRVAVFFFNLLQIQMSAVIAGLPGSEQ